MKIFASDYDGTFYQEKIDPKDVEAVQRFRRSENVFGFVSGRCLNMLLDEVESYSIQFDFVVACNGALVADKDKNVLYMKTIPFADAMKIKEILNSRTVWESGITNGIDFALIRSQIKDMDTLPVDQQFFYSALKEPDEIVKDENIVSFYVITKDKESCLALKEKIESEFSSVQCCMNKLSMDIVAKSCSKSSGLLKMKECFGYDAELYVIGDSGNDLSMIEDFNGFAVASSDEEVLNKASRVYDHVADALDDLLTDGQ